jgi:hypothetical protein
MELLYRWDDTFKGYNANWTNQAMRITITWSTLIGATKYNELNFDFAKLNYDEWDKSNSNDELINQTVWFTWLYSLTDTSMLTWYIQNTQATQY